MSLRTELNLSHLQCITPTDPSGEDEPYVWVFFLPMSSPGVRQSKANQFRFSANVNVFSGSGRPGNLRVKSAISGSRIRIPKSIGHFETRLNPVVLTFIEGSSSTRIFIPGTLFCFAAVIDEEATPRDCMEQSFNDLKEFVRDEINEFLNTLDLGPMWTQAKNESQPTVTFLSLLVARINGFLTELAPRASAASLQSATICVLGSSIFNRIASALDPDEPVGSVQMQFTEQQIIAENLSIPLNLDLRQSQSGLGGAWYRINGNLTGRLALSPVQIKSAGSVDSQRVLAHETAEVSEDKLCMPSAGTKIEWKRLGNSERQEIYVEYPFVQYRYMIANQELQGNTGTVTIPVQAQFPEFDITSHSFTKYRTENRSATIRFQRSRIDRDIQIERLVLLNDPADGNYDFALDVSAVLGNGQTIPIGTEYVSFDGQAIKVPKWLRDATERCLDEFGIKRAISKYVTAVDLWGPYGRTQKYEELIHQAETIASTLGHGQKQMDPIRDAIAARLKVSR
jgi:hypothetical protein